MKRTVLAAFAVFLICPLIVPMPSAAQSEAQHTKRESVTLEQVQSELSEAIDAVLSYSADRRDEAMIEVEGTLARLDKEIDVLEERTRDEWANMSKEAQQRVASALRDLRRQRNRLAERSGEMRQGADNAWDDLKGGFSDAWGEMKSAWQAADEETVPNID